MWVHAWACRLTPENLGLLKTTNAVDDFRQMIEMERQNLRRLQREAARLIGKLEEAEEKAQADAARRDNDNGGESSQCCVCDGENGPAVVVFFPCKQRCLCEACWAVILQRHEAAKEEKAALEADKKPLPERVKRDAVLRCPSCNTEGHAGTLDNIKNPH